MNLRELTTKEIEKLASRKGVKKIAVENFLMTVTNNKIDSIAFSNLFMDARLYKWNAATVKAIQDGIKLSAKK